MIKLCPVLMGFKGTSILYTHIYYTFRYLNCCSTRVPHSQPFDGYIRCLVHREQRFSNRNKCLLYNEHMTFSYSVFCYLLYLFSNSWEDKSTGFQKCGSHSTVYKLKTQVVLKTSAYFCWDIYFFQNVKTIKSCLLINTYKMSLHSILLLLLHTFVN